MTEHLYPLIFEPNLHQNVWGGESLCPLKGLHDSSNHIGESWEISAIPTSVSIVATGAFAGRTLQELIDEFGAHLLGHHIYEKYGQNFPLLVKFIDAANDLSIQVHPTDEIAQKRHNMMGKTEMWYVIKSEPGAKLISGFSKNIDKEEYARRVADGSITEVLAIHEVHPGDVFFIPAGRVHSIGGGIILCEIQQSSDVTYRLYDYGRLGLDGKPRELHTEAATEALDFSVQASYHTPYEPKCNAAVPVVDCPQFQVNVVCATLPLRRELLCEESFVTLSCLQGACTLRTHTGHEVGLRQGFSCLIPAVEADYTILPTSEEEVRLLEAWAR